MNRARSGLVTVTFRALPPEEVIRVAKDSRLSVLEWGGDVHVPAGDVRRAAEVAALTSQAGLSTICYGSYYRAGHEGEGEGATFGEVLETAVALKAPAIRVWAGTRGSDQADATYVRTVCKDLGRIATLAEDKGVRVALEFHGGTLNDTPEASRALLAALPHPNLDSLWQPLVSLSRRMQDESLEVVLPRLAHVHVFQWLPGHPVERRPLRDGADAWRGWFARMREAGKSPDALLEFVRDDDPSNLPPDAAVLSELLA